MKVIVVFASMTGNTEEMAEAVAEGIREEGAKAVLKDVFDTNASELAGYDAVLLGAYTWGTESCRTNFSISMTRWTTSN